MPVIFHVDYFSPLRHADLRHVDFADAADDTLASVVYTNTYTKCHTLLTHTCRFFAFMLSADRIVYEHWHFISCRCHFARLRAYAYYCCYVIAAAMLMALLPIATFSAAVLPLMLFWLISPPRLRA